MQTWYPNEDGCKEIISLFEGSLGGNNEVLKQCYSKLEEYAQNAEYCNYLAFILAMQEGVTDQIKEMVALGLKSHLDRAYNMIPRENLQYVKGIIVQCLNNPNAHIAKAIGTTISALFTLESPKNWPELFQIFVEGSASDDPILLQTIVETVSKIIEDANLDAESSFYDLVNVPSYGKPFSTLVPRFLQFCDPKGPQMLRAASLKTLNLLIYVLPSVLQEKVGDYLQTLTILIEDPFWEVRKGACEGIVALADVRKDFIMPNLEKLIDIMINATQDKNNDVALRACEFWLELLKEQEGESRARFQILEHFLQTLLPILFGLMKYGEADIMDIMPNKEIDMKINFMGGGINDDGDDDEIDTGEETFEANWTLRKCAAKAIDSMSMIYGDLVFKILQPNIEASLTAGVDWEIRESAILCLGAISVGSYQAVLPHLQVLIAFLLEQLKDEQPLIRSITCWSLSRYSSWIISCDQGQDSIFKTYLSELLRRVMDVDISVQEAACTAFSLLVSEAQEAVTPYIDDMIKVFTSVIVQYNGRSLLTLLDSIGALAQFVGDILIKNNYGPQILQPLFKKWDSMPPTERALCPLLECFNAMVEAFGPSYAPFSVETLNKSIALIHNTLNLPEPPKGEVDMRADFIIRGLDLIGGLCEALGTEVAQILDGKVLSETLLACLKVNDMHVRQFVFSLLGDLIKTCYPTIRPYMSVFLPTLVENLRICPIEADPRMTFISVGNNACWAISEMAAIAPEDIQEHLPQIVVKLVGIMKEQRIVKTVAQNVSVAIGRIGLINADLLAPSLEDFLKPWCLSLRAVQVPMEKQNAFHGLCMIVSKNPEGVIKFFPFLCDAICCYHPAPQELEEMFREIIHKLASMHGEEWPKYFSNFPMPLQNALKHRFGLN